MSAPSLFNRKNRPFVSYTANLEDVIVNRVFSQDSGFYVDVGAHNPKFGSVTWALYQRGWNGIVIEPIEHLCRRFKERRPRDISLCIAVGEQEGEVPFFIFGGGSGHSTSVQANAKNLQNELNESLSEIRVPMRTLASVFEEHTRGRAIDLLSIDAEGAEAAILRGARLDKYRPKLIVIEAMEPFRQIDASQESSKILENNDYILGYEDGLNKFFVAKEHKELLPLLRYPPNIFDNYITHREAALQNRVAKIRRRSWWWFGAFLFTAIVLVIALVVITVLYKNT